jgi:DNA-binding LacI/PurR family transcriptional regulator
MNSEEGSVSDQVKNPIPRSHVTIYDVAELARVSTSTVSRILAGFVNYTPETKRWVLAAVQTLGYVPNDQARKIASMRVTLGAGVVDENPKESNCAN